MGDQFREFLNKKNLSSLLVLAILVLAIPVGLQYLRQTQVLKSKAAGGQVLFVSPGIDNSRTAPNGSPVTVAVDQTVGLNLGLPNGWLYATPSSSPALKDLTGSYNLTFTTTSCPPPTPTSSCQVGQVWPHTMNIITMDTTTGSFSGTGSYTKTPLLVWKVTGNETPGGFVTFHISYDPPNNYTIDGTGQLASDGSWSGSSKDS